MNEIYNVNCLSLAAKLPPNSIDLICTSPPYAEQRKNQYGGVSEIDYPQWTVCWLEAFRHALAERSSVAIVIRPHIKNGQIPDYILRTRLAVRAAGWVECEELIWIKPDSPPLGSIYRPRRAWESVLWFSKNSTPFCDPKANGTPSDRIGFESKKGVGDYIKGIAPAKKGTARCKDYVEIGTSKNQKNNQHPAQYPVELASWIIRLLCPPGGCVCDPFLGSGATGVAAIKNGNHFCGSEIQKKYFEIAQKNLTQ